MEVRSAPAHKTFLEQVNPRSSSRGPAVPRGHRARGRYTTRLDEIWSTTFKERRWGRGRRKPNKRDILLSAKNQEGKRKKKKKKKKKRKIKGKKKKKNHHLSISHGELVALAPGSGCPGGGRRGLTAPHGPAPLRRPRCCTGKGSGVGLLCPGSQRCPR